MSHTPTPSPIQAVAPDLARRVTIIVAALAALVARRFLTDPRLVPLIIPLWTRLTRTGRRFDRLMARLAANCAPKPHAPGRHAPGPHAPGPRAPGPCAPGPQRPKTDTAARPPALPTGHAWLIQAIPYEAAAYACQLEAVLAEPGVADLLAAHPAAARILRPLGRMLGLHALAPKRIRPKRPRQPAKPRAPNPFAKPLHPGPDYRPSAKWPRGPWPKRRSPTPWLTARLRGETPA